MDDTQKAKIDTVKDKLFLELGKNERLSPEQLETGQAIAAEFLKIAANLLEYEPLEPAKHQLILSLFGEGVLKGIFVVAETSLPEATCKAALQDIALPLYERAKRIAKASALGIVDPTKKQISEFQKEAVSLLLEALQTEQKHASRKNKQGARLSDNLRKLLAYLKTDISWQQLLKQLKSFSKKKPEKKKTNKKLYEKAVDPVKMYEKLGVDPLSLMVGHALLEMADPARNGVVLDKVSKLRTDLTDKLGYIIPYIRVMDSLNLEQYTYSFQVRNIQVAVGRVFPNRYMVPAYCFEAENVKPSKYAIEAMNPYEPDEAVYWLLSCDLPDVLVKQSLSAPDVMIRHIRESLIRHVRWVITYMGALRLTEMVNQYCPNVVDELKTSALGPTDLANICINLIRERVPIKDITFIFERILEGSRVSASPDFLSEYIRYFLRRQICLDHIDDQRRLFALEFSPEWQALLLDSLKPETLGTWLALEPAKNGELIDRIASLFKSREKGQVPPVIVCSKKIRLHLFRLLEERFPKITILSSQELIPDIQVVQIGII